MNTIGKTLNIDAARWVREFHETVRGLVEEALEHKWRVVSIEQTAKSEYAATLATAQNETPDYILKEIAATFTVNLVENAPVDRAINGFVQRVPLDALTCTVALTSDEKLHIIHVLHETARPPHPISEHTGMPYDPEWGYRRN